MSGLEIVGAITCALVALMVGVLVGAIVWAYIQAAGGYIRFASISRRKGRSTWIGTRENAAAPRPIFFALRMINFQVWQGRSYLIDGLILPWTFMKPIGRERYIG